ncbi:hypothetical protein [Actinosynnema sp. NPDC020468]|uniref:protein-tyrosine phosphatase family protein n=1 Tax=Actinosynnema sp. NPDC020468 TaxID=3154488 RepID=UPI0033F707B2
MYRVRPGLSIDSHPLDLTHVRAYARHGVTLVVSALTDQENAELDLRAEGDTARSAGMRFRSVPIPDYGVPGEEPALDDVAREVEDGHVLIHCWGGVGRSSLLAAAVLVHLGVQPVDAWREIAAARGRDVPENDAQREWVDRFHRARRVGR